MRQSGWPWALRPVPVPVPVLAAALGVALGGCACCGPRHHGDAERAVGYQPGAYPYDEPHNRRRLERELARGGR
ncbi:MAG: hypothetical protein ICV73_22260 [Acetobacteraceae bacterium]|nr:hypothetical protein [Acetobacteraceae bacterium]